MQAPSTDAPNLMCLFMEVIPHLHGEPRDQRRNIAGRVSGPKAKKYLGKVLETMNSNQLIESLMPQIIADENAELAEIRSWAADRCAEMYPVTDWSYLELVLVSQLIMLMLHAKGVNTDRLKLELMISMTEPGSERESLIARRSDINLATAPPKSKAVVELTIDGFKACVANCRVFDIPVPACLEAIIS